MRRFQIFFIFSSKHGFVHVPFPSRAPCHIWPHSKLHISLHGLNEGLVIALNDEPVC